MQFLKKVVGSAVSVALLAGCTVPLKELRHSGGYGGHVMDKRMFAAHNKQLQLLRLTMILALASRMGVATIRDGKEAEAFLTYMENANSELNYLAAHVYEASKLPSVQTGKSQIGICADLSKRSSECYTYGALFESDLPQVEYKLTRLVLASLPQKQAGAFLNAAKSGDMVSSAWKFLRLAAASVDSLHRGAAVYRSEQEILALTLVADNKCSGSVTTIEDAISCLGLSQTNLFDNENEKKVMASKVQLGAFDALFAMVRTSCGLLPLDATLDMSDVQKTNYIKQRRERCGKLNFNPTVRFDAWQSDAPPQPLVDTRAPE